MTTPVVVDVESLATETVVLPVLDNVSEVPSTTFDSVLVGLCTAMPLMVAWAFWPVVTSLMFCVPAGSFDSSEARVESPDTEIFISELEPPAVEVSTRRLGVLLPSLTMLADTPRLAELIASRMPARVLFDELMVIEPPVRLPFCVNVAPVYLPLDSVPPDTVPNWNEIVVDAPLPMAAVVEVCPCAARTCDCASWVTLTA